jgi:hypothetical protein
LEVPQVREGGFYPQALEKGLHSERALNLALAEMYVQGVSTRSPGCLWWSSLAALPVHLQQKASQHVPHQSMKAEVAADLRMIFNVPNRAIADTYLAQVV